LLACTFILCTPVFLRGQDPVPPASEQEIGKRIARLDDRHFPVREQASADLSQAGISAIDELATAYLSGSTEQRWRILKILEQLSTETEEEGFYRIAAALRVLGGYQYGPGQIAVLHRKWQTGKSERAAQRLRDAGAEIASDNSFNAMGNVNNLDAMMLMRDNRVNVRGGVVILGGNPVPLQIDEPEPTGMIDPAIETGRTAIPVTIAEKQEMLDDIFQSDFDSNRRIAISSLQAGESDPAAVEGGRTTFQARTNNPFGVNDQPFPDQFGRFNSFQMNSYQPPLTATFGPNWTGTLEQMADVSAVSGLNSVEFKSRAEVLARELVAVSRIPELRVLSILDSAVDSQTVAHLADMPRLNTLVLDLNKIDAGWLDAAAQLPELSQLRLIAPPDGSIDLTGIVRLQALRQLTLESTHVDFGTFDLLKEPPFLSILFLQNCKFDLSEYRAFKSTRPQLTVDSSGNSFLGVRSPTLIGDLPGFTCRISEVVAGSAADLAGVQPGDLIRKLDGIEINTFNDLKLVVSQKQPGEKIGIEIDRNGQIINLTAELGDKANAPAQ